MTKEDVQIEVLENAQSDEGAKYLQGFDLLVGKSEDELENLNKSVLRKLDWRFLPGITAMLLMK
jgi:hypothetical protein